MARSYLCTCSVHWLGVGVGSYRGTVGVRVGVYKFRPSSAYHQRTTHSDDMLHMCSMPSYVAVPSACLSHRQPCVPAALIHTLIRTYAYTYVAAPSRHLPPTDRVSRPRLSMGAYIYAIHCLYIRYAVLDAQSTSTRIHICTYMYTQEYTYTCAHVAHTRAYMCIHLHTHTIPTTRSQRAQRARAT